jgi:predicted AlkP superfamily pyrophosphatase or phosphodiesterase
MKFNKSTPHKERIEGIINWLRLPEKERPHLLFLYFCDTDTKGHLFGPHSSEMDEAILFLDRQIGYLFKRLKDISFLDRMNIIVLSDHGMTELSRKKIVDVSEVINRHHLICSGKSPVINFFVKAGEDKQAAFADLKGKARGYKVYLKENIPPYYHYADSPLIGDILLIADKGYTVLVRKKASEFYLKKKGDHGFDNNLLDMQGIFLASGPQFKRRYRVGQLRNIDLYPLLCRIFGLGQQENIDGRIEQIEFILK